MPRILDARNLLTSGPCQWGPLEAKKQKNIHQNGKKNASRRIPAEKDSLFMEPQRFTFGKSHNII